MSDKQNPNVVGNRTPPVEDEQSEREKIDETPRSYYYDDATGYEIYEDEDETETDEPVAGAKDES